MPKILLTRRASLRLALLLTLAWTLPRTAFQVAEDPTQPVTVIFTRHAEKETGDVQERDPALTAAGEKRAQALARLLGKAGVTHLFSTQLKRTRSTLAPLAKAIELEVQIIEAVAQADQLEALRTLPAGAVAVVAGHSNTVPAMALALGGELDGLSDHPRHGPMLGDSEYDRLFVLILPATESGAVQTLELRYGD